MNSDAMEFAPRPSSKYWFAMVDNAVIRDATLTSTAIRIFCILCSYASRETRSWSLKIKTLADVAGCGETAVRDALKCLIARGVIEKKLQYKNGQQVASEFHIIGCDAPCYQDEKAEAAPCGKSEGDPSEIRGVALRKSEPSTCGNPKPELQEPILQEPDLRDAPLPPAGGAAAAEPADEIRRKAHERATINVLLNDVCCLWNAALGPLGFPQVSKITPARARAFSARVNELAARRELSWWRERITQLGASEFMRTSAKEKAGWLTLDWLLNENNLVKVTEGKYDSTRTSGPVFDRRGQPVEKFSEPEAREFTKEQEDYLEMTHAGKQFDPEYMAYLEDRYGGRKLWQ